MNRAALRVASLAILGANCVAGNYEPRELFRDEVAGFEVTYPKTWEKNSLTKGKRLAIRNADADKLGVISVSVATLKNDLADPSVYLKFCKEKLADALVKGANERIGDGDLIEQGTVKLSGHDAYRVIITYDVRQPTGAVSLVSCQVHCPKNEKLYVLNFESPAATFEENWSAFETVLTTFNFR